MLTAGDRAMLREVFTWARANGWRPVDTDRKSREWSQIDDPDSPTVNLVKREFGPDYDLRVYEWGDSRCRTFVESTSVRRAIDVLVAVGVLPLDFCSARVVGKTEFGVRYDNPEHPNHGHIIVTGDPSRLRQYIAETSPKRYELVKRHISEWGVADV